MRNGDTVAKPTTAGVAAGDSELLERFAARRDEAAFAALLRRHGPLVLSVCRRVLAHEQDAEDAYQATFLVLARRAGAIRKRDSVGSWLYGVAYRIARKAKTLKARRPVRTSDLADHPGPEETPEWVWRDLRPLLDEEVNRLPLKYRLPFILHYLEGRSTEEAARQMGCPVGTILSRLARARERLRVRLGRRGLAFPAALLATALGREAAKAIVPGLLSQGTLEAAVLFARGEPRATAVASATGLKLAEDYLKGLARVKWKSILAGLAALAVVAALLLLTTTFVIGPRRFAPPGPVRALPRTDVDLLQGAWKTVHMEGGGQGVELGDGNGIVFQGDFCTLTISAGGRSRVFQWAFHCDEAKVPKEIDLTMASGQVWRGIYSLEGEDLKLCYAFGSADRPTAFATQPGESVVLYEFRRVPETGGKPDTPPKHPD